MIFCQLSKKFMKDNTRTGLSNRKLCKSLFIGIYVDEGIRRKLESKVISTCGNLRSCAISKISDDLHVSLC